MRGVVSQNLLIGKHKEVSALANPANAPSDNRAGARLLLLNDDRRRHGSRGRGLLLLLAAGGKCHCCNRQ